MESESLWRYRYNISFLLNFCSEITPNLHFQFKDKNATYYWRKSITYIKKTLESPLDSKTKLVNPKGNQSWIFIGRTDAEAEAPIFWLRDAKSWLTGKDPDAGKDWRQKEKGVQRIIWLQSITDSMNMNPSKLWEIVKDRGAWHAAVHGVTKSQPWLSDWTATNQVTSHWNRTSCLHAARL